MITNKIPDYIQEWLDIIENMNNDNTYKLAWGRALLKCISEEKYQVDDNLFIINFDSISKYMIEFYWNQIFFFNLRQTSHVEKNPVLVQYVNELIENYKDNSNSSIPVWFNKGKKKIDEKLYESIINKTSNLLNENVCWRFKIENMIDHDIYKYNKNKKSIIYFKKENLELLRLYSHIINNLLNFKWTQLLEKYNFSPKISIKVNGISDSQLRRSNLTKYKSLLLKEFDNNKAIDFYTGEELEYDNISVDHVLPWSFMYSDDIWNLVITSKSNNSKKSNSTPTAEQIINLIKRNIRLLDKVDDKNKKELLSAIENRFVQKFYFDLSGNCITENK